MGTEEQRGIGSGRLNDGEMEINLFELLMEFRKRMPRYVIRGDNCTYDDLAHPKQILGVMEGFFADERNTYIPADDLAYLEYVKKILNRSPWILRLQRLPRRILRRVSRMFQKRHTDRK